LGKGESAETTGETEAGSETSEENTTETPEQPNPESAATPEKSEEEKKKEVEKLQTVIKVDGEEATGEEKKEEAPAETIPSEEKKEESSPPAEEKKEEASKPIVPKAPQAPAEPAGGSRDDLEQRRNMLQSIKDFDFQIKKNQEDIGKMVEKLDGLTKDLDDLVSLYEIVSEQMNPFVGLSKVTKKRIDALENFTNEIEDIKTRMGDVESVVEKGVGGITRLTKKLDEKKPTPDSSETPDKLELELKNAEVQIDESPGETVAEPIVETKDTPSDTVAEPEVAEPVIETPTTEIKDTPNDVIAEPETQITETVNISLLSDETQLMTGDLSDDDLDILLSKSLESLLAEQNIDYLINECLISLKEIKYIYKSEVDEKSG